MCLSIGIVFDVFPGIMGAHPKSAIDVGQFVSVLWVGHTMPEAMDACREENIGVLVSLRGEQLLRHFRVKAVVCVGADPKLVMALAGSQIPIIVLARAASEWSIGGVTVISADTPADTLACLIRAVALGTTTHGSVAA